MPESAPTTCQSCGAAATGNFCASCGAKLGPATCPACGTTLTPGARFCQKCGTAVGGAAPSRDAAKALPPRQDRTPWIVAAVLVVGIIVAVLYSANKRAEPPAPSMTNAGNAPGVTDDPNVVRAPNIDSLSPRERFIRLQTRIDQQLEKHDTTRVSFFMTMALQAYTMIPDQDRDIDVRFHAAMLQAEADMLPGARALADTIMTQSPDNLLGYYIRATVAEFAGDSAAARAARAAFRAHYDAEISKKRPEYEEHRPFLEQFRKGAGAH